MKKEFEAEVGPEGHLVLPPELAQKYGYRPGEKIRVEAGRNRVTLLRSPDHLARIYIEPTNRCNLDCVTCIRHGWDEPLGEMSPAIFAKIMEGCRALECPPDLFFGGLGEPLRHPRILDMIREAKGLGGEVEMITNGTLLTREVSEALVDAGLDRLWVSLDGATPESYSDVRLGAALPLVIENLQGFRRVRWERYRTELFDLVLKPRIGIVYVAMKRNIGDFPAVVSLANRLGALHFMVSNVLPYTPEMQDEILYTRALTDSIYASSPWLREMEFPKMDIGPETREAIYQAMRGDHTLTFGGGSLAESGNRCPFVEKGSMSIRWDGEVSPCLALMHDHTTYQYRYRRAIKRHAVGNVSGGDIAGIWKRPDYAALRRRLQEFHFSPCLDCGGCEYFESNREDCIGSPTPACGGCLWAQGVVQCP